MNSIIIFGASSGIAQELIDTFIKEKYECTFVFRKKKISQINKIKSYYPNTNILNINNINNQSINKVLRFHHKTFKCSQFAVINLIGDQGPIGYSWSNNSKRWLQTISTNLIIPFIISKNAINFSIKKNIQLSLLFFSGGGAAYGRPNFSAYASSKTGLLRMIETISLELSEKKLSSKIQINAIAPGAFKTKMTQKILHAGKNISGKSEFNKAKNLKKGSIEKIFKLTQFLIDMKINRGLSGKLIHVNEKYEEFLKKDKNLNKVSRGLLRRENYD